MATANMLDGKWTAWLRQCIRLGTDLEEIVRDLNKVGYSNEAIAAAIDACRPVNDATDEMQTPPLLRRMPAQMRRIDTDQLDLYVYDNFLSAQECERVIALSDHHLRPSAVSFDNGDKYFRTSSTAHLSHLKSPVSARLDEKICRTIGIRPEYAEGIQAQRYDVGQEFKPHCDWFQPETRVYMRMAGLRGNRTWTFMVYLNEGMEGGATRFTKVDYAVKPRTGMAVIWNNLLKDGTPNPATEHCGEPVTAGHKIIITKWFRAVGDGPCFYD
jgi:prolyl 4-hydroxylase